MHALLSICGLLVGAWPQTAPASWARPSFTVANDGLIVTASRFVGNRQFTTFDARYDARNAVLLDAREHWSCCGGGFDGTISIAQDGSYAIETSTGQRTTIPRPAGPIMIGGFSLGAWAMHQSGKQRLFLVDLERATVHGIGVERLTTAPPDGVPATAVGFRFQPDDGPASLRWFDPCTFAEFPA